MTDTHSLFRGAVGKIQPEVSILELIPQSPQNGGTRRMAGAWRGRVRGGTATRKKPIPERANEDAVLCRQVDAAIGVFDGIGAYTHARLASQIARQASAPQLSAIDRAHYTELNDALMAVGRALLAAQDGVLSLQRQFPNAGDGGTTATLAKLWHPPVPDAPVHVLFANVGDSRLYHWHAADNRLERLTSDDNIVRQWRDLGWIDDQLLESLADQIDAFDGTQALTAIAREAWEQRNTVSAWLGMEDIEFSLGSATVHPGDRIVAMSDGIHDNLTLAELTRIIPQGETPRDVAVHLLDVAHAVAAVDQSVRAKPDDMTVAVLFLDC